MSEPERWQETPTHEPGTRRATRGAAARPVRPSAVPAGAQFVSMTTRQTGGATTPILCASNPVGDALLSSGIMSLAGPSFAAVASRVPLSPVGISGFDVNEALHRFDANAHSPSLERGVSSANRVGERLGSICLRCLLAPDGFVATPAAIPPDTEIQPERSQRFVMRDGVIALRDRRHGGLRFFGAGRTYPASVDGVERLLFAGTAVVLDGSGSLKGMRGMLMISGELTPPSAISLTVIGRLDADAPSPIEDATSPLEDLAEPDAPATVLTLVGSPEGGGEAVRVARIGNDLANADHLRGLVAAGARVGAASGRLAFDVTDDRCAVPLGGSRRCIVFTDPPGRPVGAATIDLLEGTAFPERRDGALVSRVVAYGRLSEGTGALAGASGVATLDATVDGAGATASLYVLRLADPGRRFRAAFTDVYKPPPPIEKPIVFAEGGGVMNATDRTIVSFAERTLADGMELARWWEAKDRAGDYTERFDVVREYNARDRSFGFFDTATIAGSPLRVMGISQEMFYDRQKMASPETVRAQIQEFVLRYLMRVSHFREPEPVPGTQQTGFSAIQRALSWLPNDEDRRVGCGYQQLYYKLAGSGQVGKFEKDRMTEIVDMREMGRVYDWIMLKCDVFDFKLLFSPFGHDAPQLQVPMKESTYLILGPSFVKNSDHPEKGVIGEYGFGYAFVPYAPVPDKVIAYGPGHFAAATQTFAFRVMADGEVRVKAAFVVNRPDKITNVDIDPVDWSFQLADRLTFDMASRVMRPVREVADRLPLRMNGVDPLSTFIWFINQVTGGMAERQLGIAKTTLEKRMLLRHFLQHYQMLVTSLLVWRMVPDWTNREQLPHFYRQVVSS
jgi:hypothetical protein